MTKLPDVLIGSTGFVGSNLLQSRTFDVQCHSNNIELLRHRSCGHVYCCGISAKKWWANQNPEADKAGIENLMNVLRTMRAERFTLISTIDVYARLSSVSEKTKIETDTLHPYGLHRLAVEQEILEIFPNAKVIRLPGLFGPFLKKNVIFDLLNANCLDVINPESSFQYFYLTQLQKLVEQAWCHDIKVLNVTSEPIATKEIIQTFPRLANPIIGTKSAPTVRYDVKSDYASVFHGKGGYLYSKAEVLQSLRKFVAEYATQKKAS